MVINLPTALQTSELLEILMRPVYTRYLETLRGDRIFKDLKAAEIVHQVDFDWSQFNISWQDELMNAIRTSLFDNAVSNFVECYPSATIINLGSGLCSRFLRVDNGTLHWYEVDRPDIHAIRGQFFQQGDRYRWLANSPSGANWLDAIQASSGQPVLVLMEAFSMYQTEAQLRQLFQQLCDRLQTVEIVMDVVSPGCLVETTPSGSSGDSSFSWSLQRSKTLEQWGLKLQVLEESYFLAFLASFSQRYPAWLKPILIATTPLFKNWRRILRVKISN